MLSDEEKEIETLKKYINSQEQKMNDYYKIDEEFYKDEIEQLEFSIKLLRYILNLIEKQSKEIEELNKENTRQHELIGNIHKKWKDKIKAKTIEIKNRPVKDEFITASQGKLNTIIDMESLLEKE